MLKQSFRWCVALIYLCKEKCGARIIGHIADQTSESFQNLKRGQQVFDYMCIELFKVKKSKEPVLII